MPSFDLMDKVELFLQTRSFPAGTSKSAKKVTRAASKHFVYRDGLLWRSYRGRFLRVVRSDEEVREILTRYHDNNNHAGRTRAVKEIMLMYYWVGVTEAVKNWVKACTYCQSRVPAEPPEPPVRFCLAYGCDASSYVYPNLSFHRFPKEAERRRGWLEVAQRDEGSLRMNSCLCSRHFEPSCFILGEDGQLTLSPDAIPTIITVENEVGVTSDENFLQSNTLEDLLSTAAAVETTAGPPEAALDNSESPVELLEHQYSLPASDHNSMAVQAKTDCERRKTAVETNFAIYNQIARYLSHRVLPMESKKSRFALKRMAKRFGLIDGVLMYTRVSPPLRVPRSREEVNSILKQFHDNQGHYGQGICQREIIKHFYWTTMTRDLSHWINNCNTCLNRTKRKWLRCSISNCKNCCGPVERGLGLTFHKFPLNNETLLAQWIKAVGRCSWHPRLRSSICSAHFTEDCFDRSGEKVTLRPDAVPTLQVHSGSTATSRDQDQPAGVEEAFFAKYDAVALYLSRRKYPPGLTYVEKNTFRRFCKKFVIKDDELHIMIKDQILLVLRNRQQVEEALVNYHNELNHLDVNKCLRLLNERYFWKTMRSDVVQWIKNCPQCSSRKRKPAEVGTESHLEALSLQQTQDDVDSGNNDDDCSDMEEEDNEDDNEGSGRVNDEESAPVSEQRPHQKVPLLVHLKSPINLQSNAPVIFKPRGPNTPFVARIWSFKNSTPEVQKETSISVIQPENQSLVQVQAEPQAEQPAQPQDQHQTSSSQGSTTTHPSVTKPLTESHPASQATGNMIQASSQSGGLIQSQIPKDTCVQRPEKRKRDMEAGSRKRSSCGQDPVKAPSTKPWPVFTISKPSSDGDSSPAPYRRPRIPQARTVVQQCSTAKVKIKPALDGTEAEWAEIQEGMVVYVCFLQGATEDIIQDMASRLMTTKMFRKDNGRLVSVLDLPGSVLLVPQESLVGHILNKRQIQYKGACEQWWGAHLFSELVAACRELMSTSDKCSKASKKVEHGVYGPKQEIALSSMEPLTLLLEF